MALQVQALKRDEEKQRAIVAQNKATPPELLYSNDLDAFEVALKAFEDQELEELEELTKQQRQAAKQNRRAPSRKVRRSFVTWHVCLPASGCRSGRR